MRVIRPVAKILTFPTDHPDARHLRAGHQRADVDADQRVVVGARSRVSRQRVLGGLLGRAGREPRQHDPVAVHPRFAPRRRLSARRTERLAPRSGLASSLRDVLPGRTERSQRIFLGLLSLRSRRTLRLKHFFTHSKSGVHRGVWKPALRLATADPPRIEEVAEIVRRRMPIRRLRRHHAIDARRADRVRRRRQRRPSTDEAIAPGTDDGQLRICHIHHLRSTEEDEGAIVKSDASDTSGELPGNRGTGDPACRDSGHATDNTGGRTTGSEIAAAAGFKRPGVFGVRPRPEPSMTREAPERPASHGEGQPSFVPPDAGANRIWSRASRAEHSLNTWSGLV